MGLLIDGYNLLHATGLFGRGQGPGGFERSRQALLNFLVETLDEAERGRTTVVFDAAHAPPGLPRRYQQQGLTVWFASNYDDADALIEELIRADHSPRKLTVVSSDHRLHRAAGRRRATAIDSDRWYADAQLRRRERQSGPETGAADHKPQPPATPEEVRRWLEAFGLEDAAVDESAGAGEPLFPPGYGEDLEE